MAERNVLIYEHIREMYDDLGQIHLTIEELYEKGITDILIRGKGAIKFSIFVTKEQAIDIIDENFGSIIDEKIPGYKGVYGYFGASRSLMEKISPEDSQDLLAMFLTYEGTYWSINSGILEGMVVITNNFRDIKFSNIIS